MNTRRLDALLSQPPSESVKREIEDALNELHSSVSSKRLREYVQRYRKLYSQGLPAIAAIAAVETTADTTVEGTKRGAGLRYVPTCNNLTINTNEEHKRIENTEGEVRVECGTVEIVRCRNLRAEVVARTVMVTDCCCIELYVSAEQVRFRGVKDSRCVSDDAVVSLEGCSLVKIEGECEVVDFDVSI